ncbi:hypothetical protein ANO14919_132910 [Xylariales sp. No.14919]|nr:hypothetical protein ANO14919_132910 [Xylariales sp. No.14919]
MAYSGNPAQPYEPNTWQMQSQSHAEEDVYDLDDPYLIPKVLSQPPMAAGTITCRFLAIPLYGPGSFFHDITQYGHIIHESRDKLIMRVPPHNINFLGHIRQAWVSKYLAPFTECRITLDLPKWDQMTTIIIQRVLSMANRNTAAGVVDDGAAASLPGPSVGGGAGAVPQAFPRVGGYQDPWSFASWNGY